MCLLYCLGKEHRHTSCKNRSTHLLQHTPGTVSDTLGAVNVGNQGTQESD